MGFEEESYDLRQQNIDRRKKNEANLQAESVVFGEGLQQHIKLGNGEQVKFDIEPKEQPSYGIRSIDGFGVYVQENFVLVQSILSGSKIGEDRIRDLQVVIGNSEEAKFYRVCDDIREPSYIGSLSHRDEAFLSDILTELMLCTRPAQIVSLLKSRTESSEVISGILSKN
jgi:hypothetical protein